MGRRGCFIELNLFFSLSFCKIGIYLYFLLQFYFLLRFENFSNAFTTSEFHHLGLFVVAFFVHVVLCSIQINIVRYNTKKIINQFGICLQSGRMQDVRS